jgi:NadR type nicotinamide-nucleotide adenylyltransferase
MKRGFIVGKFWPPHRGHQYLIETARSQVEQLFVMLCQCPHEVPSGDLRIAWLRELYPDVHFILVDDTLGDDDSEGWAENTKRVLGFAPDVVFTSENYGESFAHFLSCQHVGVDKARQNVPVSGTKVRSAPLENWAFLSDVVRGYYAKRICLIGAESTGKTTLASQLAAHYHTSWLPEYGREYCEIKFARVTDMPWASEEFAHIARTQCEREDSAARSCNRVLVCDTDAFATSVWHERYLNFVSPEIEEIVRNHRAPDLYLLTDVDTPFVQDGTRDGEAIRGWMHERFIEKLTEQNRYYIMLSGSFNERFQQATAHIDSALNTLPNKPIAQE